MILREVTGAAAAPEGFRVTLGDGRVVSARKLLLASGVVDRLPEFEGAAEMYEGSCVPGLYVAGDASEDVQLVVVAAAEGARAGFAINKSLQKEDLALAEGPRRTKGGRGKATASRAPGQGNEEN